MRTRERGVLMERPLSVASGDPLRSRQSSRSAALVFRIR
jgi:hypothetical protein